MEAVKKIEPEYEEKIIDEISDLEELEELSTKMRIYRRKLTKRSEELMVRHIEKKEKITADEFAEQADLWKMYGYYEKSYNSLYKICYPKGAKLPQTGEGGFDLKAVKEKPNLMKDIVQKTN